MHVCVCHGFVHTALVYVTYLCIQRWLVVNVHTSVCNVHIMVRI